MPRLAMTYDLDDFAVFSRAQIRGGVGIFSGGDPVVWFYDPPWTLPPLRRNEVAVRVTRQAR